MLQIEQNNFTEGNQHDGNRIAVGLNRSAICNVDVVLAPNIEKNGDNSFIKSLILICKMKLINFGRKNFI